MSGAGGIDTHDLVSSKENIQPLRHGRNTSILCAALQAENDAELHQKLEKQRNEFEIKLRSSTSEDPISDWCEYINWIEQSFPKQAREGKLNVVLRKCINKFKDCEQYMNDIRLVKLCIKYADCEGNTVELLSQMHRHGIGVSCAEMYITWAEKYAVDNCFKKANAIYERGLQCQAQPIELLKEAHQNFQAFLVRKLINEGEIFQPTVLESNTTETRQPYNTLQSVAAGNKEVVPSVRTGLNVLGSAGKLQQINTKEPKLKSNKMIKVYEDSENACSVEEPKLKMEKVPTKKSMTKENTVKPGPWTNKQHKNVPFSVESTGIVPFQVHRDEDDEEKEKKLRAVPSTVLKSHKVKPSYEDENFENAPLFYPEPFDPTRKPMYCKEQVYAGGLEFQFEELRAIQYRKKREKLFAKRMKTLEPFRLQLSPMEGEVSSSSHLYVQTEGKKPEKPLFAVPAPPPSELPKTNYVFENQENLPNTDYSMNQTIHTKEALSEMQQLWFSKPASPVSVIDEPIKPAGKSILKPNKPCFSLYVDESCLDNLKTENHDKPLDLTLKSDSQDAEDLNPPSGVRRKTGRVNKPKPPLGNCKENVFVGQSFQPKKVTPVPEVDDSDKENGIPADYCGPVGKPDRKVSGILTPAENVEIAQLSDEEVEVEVDEDDVEVEPPNDYFIGRFNGTEMTENFTKEFQHPRGESTPCIRKSIRNKEDCNDSVFVPAEKVIPDKVPETEGKLDLINNKTIVIQSGTRKPPLGEGENFTKNLSVIAESSREYRTSSSGSSGTSTLPLRHFKTFPYTPSDTRTAKMSPSSSHKTKGQSYTGYEASSEFSQTLKSPTANKLNVTYDLMNKLNVTYDLVNKLNAIDSLSITNENDAEEKENKPEVTKEDINPFCEKVIEEMLKKVEFPKDNHWDGYLLFDNKELSTPRVGSSLVLGPEKFEVKKILGEGTYARVFKLVNTRNKEVMIGKHQKPAFPWEFYIAREIQERVKDKDLTSHFMNIEAGYFFKNASIFLTRPVEYGDLLTVINKMKQAQMMCQTVAMYFTCQILKIVETLHFCKIIHGDVKPDNFLLRMWNGKLQLQLIDFGRSIDMTLFPEGTSFKRIVTTEGLTTVEMRLGKPWTYQIDLYGVANCSHCLLFGDYMKVVEKRGVWNISKDIPRYWAKAEWRNFFKNLINIDSCTSLPDLSELREVFEGVLEESSEFEINLFKLKNLLNNC